MEQEERREPQPVQSEEAPQMSIMQKAWGIFFEPSKTFAALNRTPSWLFPVIVLIVIVMISSVLQTPFRVQEARDQIDQNPRLSAQQKEEFIDRMEEQQAKPVMKLISYVIGPLVAIFAIVFIVAGVLYFGGNVLLGGETVFKKVLSIYCWSSLVAVPAFIVKMPLMMVKKTAHIHTSLAAIMPSGSDESLIFKILSHTDIFTIWEIWLIVLGLAIIYKFSTKKTATMVVGLYIVYVIIAVGFSMLTKGRFMMG